MRNTARRQGAGLFKNMRILFAASPAVAVPALRAVSDMELEGKGIELAGILTNPDSRQGRHACEEPTFISAAVSELNLVRKEKGFPPVPQFKPPKLNSGAREEIAAVRPELLVSFACGYIFGPLFMALFPLGGINIHPSLLPKYRGASPIPAVILARERETGICIQRLAAEVDTGDILAEERFPLSGQETALSLCEIIAPRAARLLADLLGNFSIRSAAARPQEGESSYCGRLKKESGLIDWSKTAVEIDAQIRAFTPWPLSFTRCGTRTLFILKARPLESPESADVLQGGSVSGTVLGIDRDKGILIQTGDGILAVSRLQWQSKKALDCKAFSNGARDFICSRLG